MSKGKSREYFRRIATQALVINPVMARLIKKLNEEDYRRVVDSYADRLFSAYVIGAEDFDLGKMCSECYGTGQVAVGHQAYVRAGQLVDEEFDIKKCIACAE